MAVAVEGQGDTVSLDDAFEHQQVAVSILLLPEQGERDCARGVVRSTDECEVGSSALQPIVSASINLQQHPLLGVSLPSAAVLGGSARPWSPDTIRQQDPSDGRPGQMDTLSLCQHLGQMGVVESCIHSCGQLPHSLLHRCSRSGGWLPASVTVSHGSWSLHSVGRQ